MLQTANSDNGLGWNGLNCIVVVADRKRLTKQRSRRFLSSEKRSGRGSTYNMTVSSIFSVYTADLARGFDALRVLAVDENGSICDA